MNKRPGWQRIGLSAGLTLMVLLGSGIPVRADEYVCVGEGRPGTVDDLRVPAGEICTLRGTRVKGTIQCVKRSGNAP